MQTVVAVPDGLVAGEAARYCEECGEDRPAAARHCRVCRACVPGQDHHCFWLNNCVGLHNLQVSGRAAVTHQD